MVVPIIRPKSFVGPERLGVFALLSDWARDGRNFSLFGSGRNRYRLLDVEDLCAVVERCLTLPPDRADATLPPPWARSSHSSQRDRFAGQSSVTHRVPCRQGAIGVFKRLFWLR